ncbi:class I SAM-dependent methyltransferase [Aeoliella sp.]|uniref:class I SAM-dependent methyltransferase n=1 Tax=Aeoliella sp. TaxID=2795800 RepID=UPI003CCBD85E
MSVDEQLEQPCVLNRECAVAAEHLTVATEVTSTGGVKAEPRRRERRRLWQDYALAAGSLLGERFAGIKDLHFGLWQTGDEITLSNLSIAQQRYSEFVIGSLPVESTTILDVGCGNGRFADRLLMAGKCVTCVSPNLLLNRAARELLGNRAVVIDSRFEQMQTANLAFDVILFVESFQYVDMEGAMRKAVSLMRPAGRIVICDFFRRSEMGVSPISGGHAWEDFESRLRENGLFVSKSVDITHNVAPTFDLVNDVFQGIVAPLYAEAITTLEQAHPVLSKIARWTLRRKLQKFQHKYLGGQRTGEAFASFKTYRLVELRHRFTRHDN